MLIHSRRHTERDLRLWRAHEEADRVHAIRERVREAVDAITAFAADDCYAGTSWGKDSVAVCHLLWLHARNVPLIHLRPTNHNPDCDAVRDAYFAAFPGQAYHEELVSYAGIDRVRTPAHELDRLTDQRWFAAIGRCEQRFGRHRILGIRAEESTGRRIRMLRWGTTSKRACAPIGNWSTRDVFAYLAQHGVPAHPAYAMLGGGRWKREKIRVAEIGDTRGTGIGRAEWEIEYYGDLLRRIQKNSLR